MMVYACGLASPTRLAPVIVTVWALFQFPFENVSEAVETVPSLVFELMIPIFTFAFGLLVSTTVNAAVLPASVVVRPEIGVTVMPANIERLSSRSSAIRERFRRRARFDLPGR